MSNHNGSYMLNSLLVMLERESYFARIGPEKTAEFVTDVVGLVWDYDLNEGEILDEIGERLGICDQCLRHSDRLDAGVCPSCK